MTSLHKYGWRRSQPDHRDYLYAPVTALTVFPPFVDLTTQMPAVYDQKNLGSCTANAIAAAYEFNQMKENQTDFVPSRLFIYYGERAIEGTINEDAGAIIRDGFKVIASLGVCKETIWPYDTTKFSVQPNHDAYVNAKIHTALKYSSVPQTEAGIKQALVDGYPVVFGITVYESFESQDVAVSGEVPMPQITEAPLGGHAILCVGYDDATQRFKFRNSWGTSWALDGYATIPYAYLTNTRLADDFWVLESVQKSG